MYFLQKHTMAFFVPWNTKKYFNTMFWVILNRKITHKNVKNLALTIQQKNTCLKYGNWNEKALFSLSWEHTHGASQISHSFTHAHVHKWPQYRLTVTNKFYWVGKFTDTEYVSNKGHLLSLFLIIDMVSNPFQNSGKLTSVLVNLHKPASAQHGLD